jgi:ankyrin repeat protein
MTLPTQVFLDKLTGWTEGNNTKRRLMVPQASDDVEHGVHQQSALPAAVSHEIEDGVDWPDSPVPSSQEMEDGVDHFAYHDIEDDINLPSPTIASHKIEVVVEHDDLASASTLLKGVTAEGDTALHVVATHGESMQFSSCACIINTRDQGLLFVVNKKGDTPLHCAARAGRCQMVSCLIDLAGSNRVHELLRKENVLKETALHDAVRIGNKHIVETLLKADPELANYPRQGTSPLYLAILLERDVLARTLHNKSNGNLSYNGPHGQNALHAATSGDSGTNFAF